MPYVIKWMSCSQWTGTEMESNETDETYETIEEAQKALAEMQADSALMQEVQEAAVEAQGVEGWLKIDKAD